MDLMGNRGPSDRPFPGHAPQRPEAPSWNISRLGLGLRVLRGIDYKGLHRGNGRKKLLFEFRGLWFRVLLGEMEKEMEAPIL